MKSLYSYYDYSAKYSLIVRVEAESIIEADILVKSIGLNPARLNCTIGVRYVCVDHRKIKTAYLSKSVEKVHTVVHDHICTSGTVFVSRIFDSEQEAINSFIDDASHKNISFTEVFLEYPSMEQYKQRQYAAGKIEQELFARRQATKK
jgi:hypothetical protein